MATYEEHRYQAPQSVRCAVITVSDTRTLESDVSGKTIVELLEDGGHQVVNRQVITDDLEKIRDTVKALVQDPNVDAVLLTGGTGIGSRDQTYEAIAPLMTKQLPGFGELFRMLSYQEIGSPAMLSRAFAGVIDRKVVVAMPGSKNAVRLAMEKLVVPELGHMIREATR